MGSVVLRPFFQHFSLRVAGVWRRRNIGRSNELEIASEDQQETAGAGKASKESGRRRTRIATTQESPARMLAVDDNVNDRWLTTKSTMIQAQPVLAVNNYVDAKPKPSTEAGRRRRCRR